MRPARLFVVFTLLSSVLLALPSASAASWSFTSSGGLTILDQQPASVYPLPITVSGVIGPITRVVVTLDSLSHTWPADIDVQLVSPTGQEILLISDAGSGTELVGATLVFRDDAATSLTDAPIASGAYQPTDLAGDSACSGVLGEDLPAPAPASSGATALSTFSGSPANGVWKLFVVDDCHIDAGSLGSWSITIETATTVPGAPVLTLAPGPVDGAVDVSWTVPDNGHSSMHPFEIYRGVSPGALSFYSNAPLTNYVQETFHDTGLAPGSTMYYAVRAVNGIGPGPFSAEESIVVPGAPPPVPTPELPAIALLAVGLVGVALVLKRRT